MTEQKVVIRVYFADDSFKTLAVSSEITASELREVMAEKIELEPAGKPYFDLFLYKAGESRSIEPNEKICKLIIFETLCQMSNGPSSSSSSSSQQQQQSSMMNSNFDIHSMNQSSSTISNL